MLHLSRFPFQRDCQSPEHFWENQVHEFHDDRCKHQKTQSSRTDLHLHSRFGHPPEKGIQKSLFHYTEKNDFHQVFYYAKNSDYAKKCLQLLMDADTLSAFCGECYKDWDEYPLFRRCLSEQTVREEGGRRLATHKDGTINSSILQNPSDPEATFRNKAG